MPRGAHFSDTDVGIVDVVDEDVPRAEAVLRGNRAALLRDPSGLPVVRGAVGNVQVEAHQVEMRHGGLDDRLIGTRAVRIPCERELGREPGCKAEEQKRTDE